MSTLKLLHRRFTFLPISSFQFHGLEATCKSCQHWIDILHQDFEFIPDFVNPSKKLTDWLQQKLSKMPYQSGHYDGVIYGYRETLLREEKELPSEWQVLVNRVRERMDPTVKNWLAPHILDLHAKGYIQFHVDHQDYSGKWVAVLSLLSDAELALRPAVKDPFHSCAHPALARMIIPKNSLYIQKDNVRYHFEHAILKSSESRIKREQARWSIVFRDQL